MIIPQKVITLLLDSKDAEREATEVWICDWKVLRWSERDDAGQHWINSSLTAEYWCCVDKGRAPIVFLDAQRKGELSLALSEAISYSQSQGSD